ncbi:MAG: DUF1830 domain-containing protein [Coleofasciculus sp. S288]|nr:DUF1830 domain-containing protein [Coleofasciculus sp. S288]
MAQILDSLPPDKDDRILCCYVNATSHIQIARISSIPNWYFERVVFPGQRLVFEAMPEALLEIHTGMMASAILSDTIPCDRLRLIDEYNSTSANPVSEVVAESTDKKQTLETVNSKNRVTTESLTLATLS